MLTFKRDAIFTMLICFYTIYLDRYYILDGGYYHLKV